MKMLTGQAAAALALLLIPAACRAFGGKVTYPDGKPAASAQVNLILYDAGKTMSQTGGNPGGQPQTGAPSGQGMGKGVSPKQGAAAPRTAPPVPGARGKVSVKCDASGRFSFPDQVLTHAMVQIRAPHDKDFATVILPAKVFQGGDVAIVLQPKR